MEAVVVIVLLALAIYLFFNGKRLDRTTRAICAKSLLP